MCVTKKRFTSFVGGFVYNPECMASCSVSHGITVALTEKTVLSSTCLLDRASLKIITTGVSVFYIWFTEVQLLPSVSLEAPVYDTQAFILDINVIWQLTRHSDAIFGVLSASWASLIFYIFQCVTQPLIVVCNGIMEMEGLLEVIRSSVL